MSSDDERDKKELSLTSPEVVTKYKSAAKIVNKALQVVLAECKPKSKIVDICEKGDVFIKEQTASIFKKIKRGVAFPTCISVNNTVGHFSPPASDETVLECGDMVKIDMGCHIDGFIALVGHTHVLQEGPIRGRKADVIAAANTAAEVALRLVRPGKKNTDVTEAIQKVAAAYDCKIVEGVLSHLMKQHVIDGNKVVLSVASPEATVEDVEFEENEVYAIDIMASTGDGHLQPYPVLHEKPGYFVAQMKFTVLLMPNGSDRITSHTLQELQPTNTIADPEIKGWLALGIKNKKGGGKKKKTKKAGEKDDTEQLQAAGVKDSSTLVLVEDPNKRVEQVEQTPLVTVEMAKAIAEVIPILGSPRFLLVR